MINRRDALEEQPRMTGTIVCTVTLENTKRRKEKTIKLTKGKK
jgi:hypothetical protein